MQRALSKNSTNSFRNTTSRAIMPRRSGLPRTQWSYIQTSAHRWITGA